MAVRYNARRSFRDYFNDLMDDTYFDINGRMIGLLPKFRGTNVDNPLTHLRDVHIICNALRPRGVDEADFMLRMFLYSLKDYAQSWLFSLSVDSMPTWDRMRQLFLKEYSIKQHPRETTYEYFQRFRDLLETCPDYSFPEHVLIISFLDGMNLYEREMMDVMAGGSIVDCYPEDAWELIYTRAAQTKPYEFPNSMYVAHQEDTLNSAPEWGHDMQLTRDLLAKLTEPVPQVICIVPQGPSEPKESSSQATPNPPSDQRSREEEANVQDHASMIVSKECTEVKEVGLEKQSALPRSSTEPLAQSLMQPQTVVQPVAQTQNDETGESQASDEGITRINSISHEYSKTVLEAQSIEEVCEDKESMSLPTPISLDDMPTSDPIVEEEEEEFVQDIDVMSEALQGVPTTCNGDINTEIEEFISSHRSDTTTEQNIVFYTPNMLLVPNILLSFHIQECKHKTLDKEKTRGSLYKVTTQSPLIHICKQRCKHERSLDEVCVNWKSRKKAKRMTMDEEVSLFFISMRQRHTSFGWKPGWDICIGANSKATKKVGRCWKKFDGAHPWAPNI